MIEVDRDRIARVAGVVLDHIAPGVRFEVTIAIVRDNLIRQLNRRYRGKNSGTDVLSFPGGTNGEWGPKPPEKPAWRDNSDAAARNLGDVVISADTAARQATDARHSIEREIDELIIHGVLHLCGYDHETDNGEMDKLELSIRAKLVRRKHRSS